MQQYQNPLIERYASQAMMAIFSPEKKFKTWRRCWVALAESQKELGLQITDQQLAQMRQYADSINYEVAIEQEKKVRHDVMSHIYAYGQQAPLAKPIIHLGATSCFVGDNTDLLVMYEALQLLRQKCQKVLFLMRQLALDYKNLPTLGFTHYQPAQLTTVGKRVTLWMEDLYLDYQELEQLLANYKLRGVKGTTGTQASFLTLFEGDHQKVKELDKKVAMKLGGFETFPVTGQTYSRKMDAKILSCLSGIAQSVNKFTNDLRLLQNLKELEEPFAKNQIGSSAMAYKRNPMRSERMASLARFVMVSSINPVLTASQQWLERTLDDSANKRLAIPESFLAVDSLLEIYANVIDGLVVYDQVIAAHIEAELPFMATEEIIMQEVKRGGDRQEIHEAIRRHSMDATKKVKLEGKANDLIERLADEPMIKMTKAELQDLLSAENFIGRAPQQVDEFIKTVIDPILVDYQMTQVDELTV